MSEAAHDLIAAQSGGRVMETLSRSLRAMFVAAPGHVLVGGDFSNIEGRINAWMAGEQWKLDAFRAYDAGTGPDLYKLAYMKAFGVTEDAVGFVERDIGKKAELSAGYQGSVGAYLRFVNDVTPIVRVIRESFEGSDAWLKAAEQHDRLVYHNGLSRDEWTAVKIIMNGWRESQPEHHRCSRGGPCRTPCLRRSRRPARRSSFCDGRAELPRDGRVLVDAAAVGQAAGVRAAAHCREEGRLAG